ncbi:M12 family metallo-peptidase [Jejuia pallidilutea]|nr:M12 family metallo-peptidase [Jejuia pallidilutea]GAL67374.1 hypothetical protein JCM19301_2726 [Jejuia pallidilutea]GAL70966.1 hypothetical protein JCM19302_2921 [Jejuia pallidilutea]
MSKYEVLDLDISAFEQKIKSSKESNITWEIDGESRYKMKIRPKSIKSKDAIIGRLTENGFESDGEEKNKEKIRTYRGNQSNGKYVRLTVDDDFIYGVIKTNKGVMVIDQLKYVLDDNTIPSNKIVLYEIANLLDTEGFCSTIEEGITKKEITSKSSSNHNCRYLELAVDCDLDYYYKYGGNTFSRIEGVINNIQAEYADNFNLDILIIYEIIGFNYNSTNPITIISEIQNLWSSSSYINKRRDLVHHFTAKDLGSNLGRASGIGDICNNSTSVCYTKDRVGEFLTVAHEIGHNLGGLHGDGQSCGTSNASIMCQGTKRDPMYFSAASTTRIGNFIDSQTCLLYEFLSMRGETQLCDQIELYTIQDGASQNLAGVNVTWSTNNALEILSVSSDTRTARVRRTGNTFFGQITASVDVLGGCQPIVITRNLICSNNLKSETNKKDKDITISNSKVYPNPTNSILNVKLEEEIFQYINNNSTVNSNVKLELYDIYGKRTKSQIYD